MAAATSVSSEQPEATEDDDAASSGAIVIEAFDIGFDVTEVTIPADVDTDIEVVNAGSIPHDLVIEDTEYATPILVPGRSEILTVNLPAGEYIYFCSVPGHRGGGMEGTLIAE